MSYILIYSYLIINQGWLYKTYRRGYAPITI